MKITPISCRYRISPNFGDKVLTDENQKSVTELRVKLNSMVENGIPVGNCYYKIFERRSANLYTNDNKYKAAVSSWGNNLLISEDLPMGDMKKAVISPENDVFYTDSFYDKDINEVKENTEEEKIVNEFLKKVLPKFL